jgi:signal transduction histidine kinase
MKTLLGPSLFRRFLFTSLALVMALFLCLVAWQWLRSQNADVAMVSRALATFSGNVDSIEARRVGDHLRDLFVEFSSPHAEKDEVQYAVFHGRTLVAKSDYAPMEILEAIIANPPSKAVDRSGWYVRAALVEKTGTTAVFAIRKNYFTQMISSELLISLLLSIGTFLLITAITAWIGSIFALRPIRQLTRRILALEPLRFDALTIDDAHAELLPVVNAINQRTEAIKAQVESERSFFSNAAHELRTPLAVITTQAHGVERAKTVEERMQRVNELHHGVERAAHTLGRMLQLAKLDSSAVAPTATRQNLGMVITDCVAFHVPRAFTRKQSLAMTELATIDVMANRDDLVTIIDNLVENAINYAGEGASITVEVGMDNPQMAYFSVADDGPGFSAADHKSVFERFQRGSQAEQHAGTGLGLAIVKAAAQRFGGSVAAMDAVGEGVTKGLRVKVSVPVASE